MSKIKIPSLARRIFTAVAAICILVGLHFLGGMMGDSSSIFPAPHLASSQNVAPYARPISKAESIGYPILITENGRTYDEKATLDLEPDFIQTPDGKTLRDNIVSVQRVTWPSGGYSTFGTDCIFEGSDDYITCVETNGTRQTFGLQLKQP